MAPKAPSHAPYITLISEAVKALKERSGSSLPAIKKYVGDKHPGLPTGWEKQLAYQLKRLAAAGKLVKVKASYKLGEALKKPVKKVVKKPTVAKTTKPKAAKKPTKPKAVKAKADGEKKKTVKKVVAAKPKKAAAPKVKKTTTTKKAAKPAAAKKVVKKPAAKKPAAKKAAPKTKAPKA